MEVHLTPEQEAELTRIAINAGTDAELLVRDTVLQLLKTETRSETTLRELPAWDLGVIGPMHRHDLYDDAS